MLRSSALVAASLSLAFLVQAAPTVSGQSAVTTAKTYVCPKCGRIHTRGATSSTQVATGQATSQYSSTPVTQTSYKPAVYASPTTASGASSAFVMLNGQRARQGVPSLMYDPTLQAVAQQRAQKMASMGIKGHPPGSFSPGRYEGVGWSSSYSPGSVSACYTSDRRMRYAGAAMVRGRDGVYFAVVYR